MAALSAIVDHHARNYSVTDKTGIIAVIRLFDFDYVGSFCAMQAGPIYHWKKATL